MAKHIHIHVTRPTRDAGSAHDPSGIKRDAGGKFATTGSGGGDRKHHEAQEAVHRSAAEKIDRKTPQGNADWHNATQAADMHGEAHTHLRIAQQNEKKGRADLAAKHHEWAKNSAAAAKHHEQHIGNGAPLHNYKSGDKVVHHNNEGAHEYIVGTSPVWKEGGTHVPLQRAPGNKASYAPPFALASSLKKV